MNHKETAIKIINIMDIANKYRPIAKNPHKKKDISSRELENWYESVIECGITKRLVFNERDRYKLECQALIKFRDIINPYRLLHLQVDKFRRYLNMMIDNLDIFYPILYRRYFQIPYNKNTYGNVLKNIIK